ncbi:hypothetical protein [Acetobacter papayae]|uniref:hypothetical protein n=1 Tax=Acetobacter papayae TaxID=1076592 RepID=UPI000A7FD166|nr:hypothetical protein [Acetobacter papayae]
MATLRHRIDGPQDHHEQRGGIAYRDTRTLGTRIFEASAHRFPPRHSSGSRGWQLPALP